MLHIVKDTFDLLTFRFSRERFANLGYGHLAFGLVCTWIVGIGRYWDNPRVGLLQHLGIGSVVYVFALALLLFLVISSFRPKDWSYLKVVTFISLVSPPAIIYAIPVQMFTDLQAANGINALFLAIVALWRLALLMYFLRVFASLNFFAVIFATLVPVMLITVSLTMLNLDRVVFNLMAGIVQESPNDSSYVILFLITYLSFLTFPIVLICYVASVIYHWAKKNNEPSDQDSN